MRARDAAPRGTGDASGPDDVTLVERAKQGDRAAYRQLVERHQRRLYRLALGIVKDHEEALDVVQEALVKVHNHLAGFKGDAAFGTWAYRITYNLAIDAIRRTGARGEKVEVDDRTLTDEGEHYDPYGVDSRSPQKASLRGELGAELQKALATLSEAHRTILLLREVEGLSYEELAVTLKIPKGTVMSRLFHARHKMQAAMKGYLTADAHLDRDPEDGLDPDAVGVDGPDAHDTEAPTPARAGGRRGS